jgi:DEAD/DEAH box helicase domain-containing protein
VATVIGRRAWDEVLAEGRLDGRVVAVTHRDAQPARTVPLPPDLHPAVAGALTERGITELYAHQARAWEALASGAPGWILTTGTASGKSLAYWLPVLDRIARARQDGPSRALYLAPTQALAQDQVRALTALAGGRLRGLVPGLYDGDTPGAARGEIRRRSSVILTNPDMLHVGILPNHARWADLLGRLDHVVVDEAHVYRGIFGSHVANVLRRLRRVCAMYGSSPRILLASATTANPAELAAGLTGLELPALGDDGAARRPRRIVLWNPPLLDGADGRRRSALTEAADLFAGLVGRGVRTLCFVKSRQAAERLFRAARGRLHDSAAARISPYRAGYTAAERRRIEIDLSAGRLLGVIATEALELGIDVGGVEAAISVGFPGTVASLTQQWGRAGRAGPGLALMIAGEDMLDQYFCAEPAALLERPVEAAVLDAANPVVRHRHLRAAAFEAPLGAGDEAILGGDVDADAAVLVERGALVATRQGAAVPATEGSPAARFGLRSGSAGQIQIVDRRHGEVIGTVDTHSAPSQVHPGAVYLHRGGRWLVEHLDLESAVCLVVPFEGAYDTEPRKETMVSVAGPPFAPTVHTASGGTLQVGPVEATEHVIGYARVQDGGRTVLEVVPLELPPTTYRTEAVWWTVPDPLLLHGGLSALHAWEHTSIGMLGAVAMCDRWDLGGLSIDWHPDTGQATVFVYEGHQGGVGIARRGLAAFDPWQATVERVLATCPCRTGCPSCVQSPKCGNGNEFLDKAGALATLRAWRD